MSSSNETAPSPESPSSPTAPPPPKTSDGNGSASSSPPAPAASSPPESSPSPPSPPSPSSPPPSSSSPPPASSPPPPTASSPPPSPSDDSSSSPPPPSGDKSPPTSPPSNSSSSGSPNYGPPPPPPHSSSSAPPPPLSTKALSPPPPPPPVHRTPTSSSSSSSSSSSPSSSSNLPLIVGLSVGLGLVVIIFIASCIACAMRKKKKKRDEMHYYMDHSHGHKAGHDYYHSSQHPNWHNGNPTSDHIVKLNQPSGTIGSPGGGGWPQPPPPPPMMSSGDMSAGYSGPRHHPPLPPPSPSLALGFNSSTFTYDELAVATGGFAQANMLGQGGFGYVHKGVLPNGKEVAVKSLKSGSGQGEREFQAEVDIISRVHHRHLVSLVGYCIAGGQRMLVYEFVPNKTLEFHLYRDDPVMDWATRLRIALGSAKGLAYIHEDCHPRIIHRDIKAANILLDNNFEAMVADFGLAKLSSDNYTHVSTRVMGTFGYLAPEYASSGKLTEKSDVFSFGVMLLEIITGRRPVDIHNVMEDSLVDWARPLLTQALDDGNYDELVDPRLENNFNRHEMARMVACTSASIRHSAKRRPKMSQIVRALDGDVSLDDLNEGVKPGHSAAFGASSSSDYDASSYNADMKRFRKVALSSQDFASSEFGASSGESREMAGRSPNKA